MTPDDGIESQHLAAHGVFRHVVQPTFAHHHQHRSAYAHQKPLECPDPGVDDKQMGDDYGGACGGHGAEHPHVPHACDERGGEQGCDQPAELVARLQQADLDGAEALNVGADDQQGMDDAGAEPQHCDTEKQHPQGSQCLPHDAALPTTCAFCSSFLCGGVDGCRVPDSAVDFVWVSGRCDQRCRDRQSPFQARRIPRPTNLLNPCSRLPQPECRIALHR